MAKKALVNKQQAEAEVQGARLHALPALRPGALGVPRLRAVPHLPAPDGARGRGPRHDEVARGEGGGSAVTMTDPIADMLTRIRNANIAFHDDVAMPSSKLKEAVAQILEREGYISGFEVDDQPGRPGRRLTIRMKYSSDRRRTISGLEARLAPRPAGVLEGRRRAPVLGGMGIAILSTNQGLLTDREARERKVGGEVLCQVW